ncbi:hypothetical protein MAM1_0619d11032 [Mucor ambiguus]|uniref:Uncharacterized protein n=1 Tax=Mucor ambiguus TaxID=91626 RepID=A0A0C9MVP2_9FUNG|nr:hypothetical protein MAM1_0619d11032 [Mucor ambiguus]
MHTKLKSAEKWTPRTKLCNTTVWNGIFNNFKRRKNAIDTFHKEAISTLTAAREVRRLIDQAALNEESAQDTIDSRHDAEDDADMHLGSSSEELPTTSDSSPSSQSSLQLRTLEFDICSI